MFTALVIIAVSLYLLLYIVQNLKKKNALPPGPPALPLLGNLLQIGYNPHLKLTQWAQQYGKFYTVHFGQKPALVITDAKLIRELLGMPEAAGSLTTSLTTMIIKGRYGLHAEGDVRLEQKRFFTRVIRQFVFGQYPCRETVIRKEIDVLIDWIKSEQDTKGKVYLNQKLKLLISNIIWGVCSGERLTDLDSNIANLGLKFFQQLEATIKSGLFIYPWIRHFAPGASGYTRFKNISEEIYAYVEDRFRKRISTRSMRKRPECIVDAYIEKMRSCQNKLSSFYGEEGWKHSVGTVVALFIAGGDGTGIMLNWIIFYLSAYPKIQEKLRKEIEEITANKRHTNLADIPNMPYAEAIILEALRFASMVPLGVPHELTEDITFHGYKLPKGLLFQPILYSVHFDKTIWGDPENFRPERFLGEGWKLKEFVVAFQPGKRTCPGQELGVDILFLFMTKLFQKFTFEVEHSSNSDEYVVPRFTFELEPKILPILAIERQL